MVVCADGDGKLSVTIQVSAVEGKHQTAPIKVVVNLLFEPSQLANWKGVKSAAATTAAAAESCRMYSAEVNAQSLANFKPILILENELQTASASILS